MARERLIPLLRFLVDQQGSQQAVALLLEVSNTTVGAWLNGRIGNRAYPQITTTHAQRIVDLVLAYRKVRDPFATFDLEPRRPPSWEERRQPRIRPACGTNNGYELHLRHGEDTCRDCRAAHAYRIAHQRAVRCRCGGTKAEASERCEDCYRGRGDAA